MWPSITFERKRERWRERARAETETAAETPAEATWPLLSILTAAPVAYATKHTFSHTGGKVATENWGFVTSKEKANLNERKPKIDLCYYGISKTLLFTGLFMKFVTALVLFLSEITGFISPNFYISSDLHMWIKVLVPFIPFYLISITKRNWGKPFLIPRIFYQRGKNYLSLQKIWGCVEQSLVKNRKPWVSYK